MQYKKIEDIKKDREIFLPAGTFPPIKALTLARQISGISAREVANVLEISRSYLTVIENGSRLCPFSLLDPIFKNPEGEIEKELIKYLVQLYSPIKPFPSGFFLKHQITNSYDLENMDMHIAKVFYFYKVADIISNIYSIVSGIQFVGQDVQKLILEKLVNMPVVETTETKDSKLFITSSPLLAFIGGVISAKQYLAKTCSTHTVIASSDGLYKNQKADIINLQVFLLENFYRLDFGTFALLFNH